MCCHYSHYDQLLCESMLSHCVQFLATKVMMIIITTIISINEIIISFITLLHILFFIYTFTHKYSKILGFKN